MSFEGEMQPRDESCCAFCLSVYIYRESERDMYCKYVLGRASY